MGLAEDQSGGQKSRKPILWVLGAVAAAALLVFFALTQFIPGMRYKQAEKLLADGRYDEAITAFSGLGDYSDSEMKIEEARELIELRAKEEAYESAARLLESGDPDGAEEAFLALKDFKDSEARVKECRFQKALIKLRSGETDEAISALGQLSDYPPALEQLTNIYAEALHGKQYDIAFDAALAAKDFAGIAALDLKLFDIGGSHAVALKRDGTVFAAGDNDFGQCEVGDWDYTVAVAAGENHTVGLESNGFVHAVGTDFYGECDVDYWYDITQIDAGYYNTVGLKKDGTVLAAGDNMFGQCNVGKWANIVAVVCGVGFTAGLKDDGTVVIAGGEGKHLQEAESWTDIIQISAGWNHIVGVRSDGTVVAAGEEGDSRLDVQGWQSVAAVYAGANCTAGIQKDGTLEAAGFGKADWGSAVLENARSWTDIVAVASGARFIAALRADGTVVCTDPEKLPEMMTWTDIGPAFGQGFSTELSWE